MKREEVERIVNPKEYNKHWYNEDGWDYLTTVATSIEKVLTLCKENNILSDLDNILDVDEEDFANRIYNIYLALRNK